MRLRNLRLREGACPGPGHPEPRGNRTQLPAPSSQAVLPDHVPPASDPRLRGLSTVWVWGAACHAFLPPHSTWRSCPSWRITPSRCRAATRRWSHCGLTGCSSVSTCPAHPCSSSEPRSTCVRWARGWSPHNLSPLPPTAPISRESSPPPPPPFSVHPAATSSSACSPAPIPCVWNLPLCSPG